MDTFRHFTAMPWGHSVKSMLNSEQTPLRRHQSNSTGHSQLWLVMQAACALAAAMGIGRFVFTPILPLMQAQAGVTAQTGADLASANYIGYLLGALIGIGIPRVSRSAVAVRVSLLILIASLALMPATESSNLWFALRLVAGAASSIVFVVAVSSMLTGLAAKTRHLAGWGFGGVGAGILLSGIMIAIIRTAGTWQMTWWISAAATGLLAAAAWRLPAANPGTVESFSKTRRRTGKWFAALWTSYTLEGVGYIIAGTFLVAAVQSGASEAIGSSVWIVVGLAAIPSSVLWTWLARRWTRPSLLFVSLAVQAIGIALPAVFGGTVVSLIAAGLFGATFMGVSSLALAIGDHLQTPRAVGLLTAGYSVGQILGPILAAPLLASGYSQAMILGSILVFAAALAAAAMCLRFPHDLTPLPVR